MLDETTAKLASDGLCTALAALMEEAVDAAAGARASPKEYLELAAALQQVAADAVVLAAALSVVARRQAGS